jgi:hypothetical protein
MRRVYAAVIVNVLAVVCGQAARESRAWDEPEATGRRVEQQATPENAKAQGEGQRAMPSLLDQQHIATPCDPSPTEQGARLVAIDSNPRAYSLHRLDSTTLSRAEMPALSLRSGPALIEITGTETQTYTVQLCAQAGADSEEDAQRLLGEIKLARKGESFEVAAPGYSWERPSEAYVNIQAPQDAPVTINGTYAAIEVSGMSAPVRVSTTHARIQVLGTTGDVEAVAMPAGMIVFSGNGGRVRLKAEFEVNLRISEQQFEGTLEATAQKHVSLLLPPVFLSPFEAVVNRSADFTCRASLCDQVRSSERDGKFVYSYGAGEPALRLVASGGTVVINSTDRLPVENDRKAEQIAHQQEVIRINELAGRIHTEADAHELTEAVAKQFGHLPAEWVGENVRNRIAHAEYEAVTNPSHLISEQRIADVWNEYVREIDAPEEALVTAAEIHTLRHAYRATSEIAWAGGNQSLWTMPNIYAMGADGKIAGGCRAFEALRVVYDLDEVFVNVRAARERLRRMQASDSLKEPQREPQPGPQSLSSMQRLDSRNPVRLAEGRYLLKNGMKACNQLVERLFDELFSP